MLQDSDCSLLPIWCVCQDFILKDPYGAGLGLSRAYMGMHAGLRQFHHVVQGLGPTKNQSKSNKRSCTGGAAHPTRDLMNEVTLMESAAIPVQISRNLNGVRVSGSLTSGVLAPLSQGLWLLTFKQELEAMEFRPPRLSVWSKNRWATVSVSGIRNHAYVAPNIHP